MNLRERRGIGRLVVQAQSNCSTAAAPFHVPWRVEWVEAIQVSCLKYASSVRRGNKPVLKVKQASTPSSRIGRTPADRAGADPSPRLSWYQSTLAIGLLGSALLFASLPPLDWWPLAWIAPLPWLLLIQRTDLYARRPGWTLYLIGFAFWMGTLHWVRLPHWAASFGWVAMSAYLAVYPWAFLLLSRVAVHRLGMSIVVAAPLVWTGLEVARGYMLGGFTMSSLAHTQYRWLAWIQLADVIGCYGMSGLVMLVAASLAHASMARAAACPLADRARCLGICNSARLRRWRTSGEHTRPGASVGAHSRLDRHHLRRRAWQGQARDGAICTFDQAGRGSTSPRSTGRSWARRS